MRYKYELPALPYPYDALEPRIDARTMEIHHSKHHLGYVNNLNAALEEYTELQEKPLSELLRLIETVPETARAAVRNNGGGHFNHSFFWKIMSPHGGGEPNSSLLDSLNKNFGSFQRFKEIFSKAATSRFGSGWAWLLKNDAGGLEVASTANQDSPVSLGMKPILGIDVWEHAYYLKHQNKRADYISDWWSVVNWEEAEKIFSEE